MAYREEEYTNVSSEYTGNGRSSAEIENEIERTRAEIDETLAALERKLSPDVLWQKGIDYLRGPSEFTTNLGNTVKENPLPVSLVGIGLVWLMAGGSRTSLPAERKQAFGKSASEKAGEAEESVRQLGEKARQKAGHYGEVVHRSRQKLAEKISGTKEGALQTGEKTREVGQEIGTMFKEQPLYTGIAGLAIGAALAGIIPTSRREQELYAEAGREFRGSAEELGGQALESVEHVAGVAEESVRQEFERRKGERRLH
jgi:hypothetical protein